MERKTRDEKETGTPNESMKPDLEKQDRMSNSERVLVKTKTTVRAKMQEKTQERHGD
jgi:hypothetical protein